MGRQVFIEIFIDKYTDFISSQYAHFCNATGNETQFNHPFLQVKFFIDNPKRNFSILGCGNVHWRDILYISI